MKKKEARETLSTVIYIILGIALAFGINQAMALALNTDMPVVAVESNSMVPTFYRGDLLILQGALPETLSEGDVIVFFPLGKSTAIVHRIVDINDDGTFQTKGDANTDQLPFEKRIVPEQIHGRSIATVPYLGWVKIGMTDYVFPNIVWIAIILVAAYGGYKVFKERAQKQGYRGFKRSRGQYRRG